MSRTTRRSLSTTVATEKGGKKGAQVNCYGCDALLADNHAGLQCPQNHHLCIECSANCVQVFLGEPKVNLPPKCMVCKVALNPSVFERQLTSAQFEHYTSIMLSLLWSKDCLNANEELIHCAFCSYCEIREKTAGSQLMFCKHQDCHKTSCLVCLHHLPALTDDYDDIDGEEYTEKMEEFDKHFKCMELKEAKAVLELAIENGQKVPCPACGLAGMKDDSCTHMRCPNCQIEWCYFCGLKEADCDKADPAEQGAEEGDSPMYLHNVDWDINRKRCPMYLTALEDVNDDWPSDDETLSLERFHRIRSLRLLRECFAKLGQNVFDQLNEQFGMITACGFSMDEIQRFDLTIIDYDKNIHGVMLSPSESDTTMEYDSEETLILAEETMEEDLDETPDLDESELQPQPVNVSCIDLTGDSDED